MARRIWITRNGNRRRKGLGDTVAGKLKYDFMLGRMRLRDVPRKAGYAGKFLHSDGQDATLPDWDAPQGAGAGGDTYVRAYWFAAVVAGTAGSLAAPTGGALVFDAWPEGVDALATELDAGGKPSWESPTEADGTPVSVALGEDGVWTLSGAPAGYPIGIVFCYRTKVVDLQDIYTLQETQPEPSLEGVEVVLAAGAAVGGHRVVCVGADGRVVHVDLGSVGSVMGVQGVSANAAEVGERVRVRTSGVLVEPSWSWTAGAPVFCGEAGVLVQVAPAGMALLPVGLALSATALWVRLGVPVFLE